MRDSDIVSGLSLVVFSTIASVISFQLPKGVSDEMGPKFFPMLCIIILGFCGLILIFKGWKRKEKKPLPIFVWSKLLPMILLFAIYFIALRLFGFIISTMLFMFMSMIFMGERKPLILIGIPIGVSFGIYYLFVKVFFVILP